MRRAGLLAAQGTAFQVVDGSAEGWEAETGLGNLANEDLGVGGGPVFHLGAGPLGTQVAGHALDPELGVGQGQSAAQGADAGLQGDNVHRFLSWAAQRGRESSRAWISC